MTCFVVAGMPDCRFYIQALHVAEFLSERLPNLNVFKIEKDTEEWPRWLLDTNQKNKWHHCESPLVWKELSMRGAKAHYIGGLSEFWEYCYDYYGLTARFLGEDIDALIADNMQFYQDFKAAEEKRAQRVIRKVMITGGLSRMSVLLLPQLLRLEELHKNEGITINLFDALAESKGLLLNLQNRAIDASWLNYNHGPSIVTVPEQMGDGLKDADLLIILKDLSRRDNEKVHDWLRRAAAEMFYFADQVNAFAPRSLRVIVANHGAVCYNASMFAAAATGIRSSNIVAVTADVGLEALNVISKERGVPVDSMGAPPVYGFVGVNQYVDFSGIVEKYDVFRPNARATKDIEGTTLPMGRARSELRFLNYLVGDTESLVAKMNSNKKECVKRLGRPTGWARVRAIVSLIKLWYTNNYRGEIISLGIHSDGNGGIPQGIIFSQPVWLEGNKWVPFENLPKPRDPNFNIEHMGEMGWKFIHKSSYDCYCIPDPDTICEIVV